MWFGTAYTGKAGCRCERGSYGNPHTFFHIRVADREHPDAPAWLPVYLECSECSDGTSDTAHS